MAINKKNIIYNRTNEYNNIQMSLKKVLFGSAMAAGVVTGNGLASIEKSVAACSVDYQLDNLDPSFEGREKDGETLICSANHPYPDCNMDNALAWYSNGGNMIRVGLDQVDDNFELAMQATEDRNLYSEDSIEAYEVLTRIAVRGVVASFNARDLVLPSGGSNLAMQVARKKYPEVMPPEEECRKFAEIAIGHQMLQRASVSLPAQIYTDPISGEQQTFYPGNASIMEDAANIFYYGKNAFGVEAASWAHFNKSSADLTYVEAAYLTALINAPDIMDGDPDPAENEEEMALAQRRINVVLDDIVEFDPSLREVVEAARAAQPDIRDVVVDYRTFQQGEEEGTNGAENLGAMHITNRIRNTVMETLELSDREFRDMLYINTTLDENVQRNIIDAVNSVDWPRDGRQFAIVAMAQNGSVLGMYGGDYAFSQVNLTTRPGPVGSSLKPYYYAWALQNGLIVPGHIFTNVPPTYQWPEGDAGNTYLVDEGAHCPNAASCTLSQAIGHSDNATVLMMAYNAEASGVNILQGTSDLMHDFGMYSESGVYPSNILGSWETSAYSLALGMNGLINNRGMSRPAYSVVSVFQMRDGQLLQVDNGKFTPAAGEQLVAPEYSDAIREGMRLTLTEGTAAPILGGLGINAACKTGSAQNGAAAAITCVAETGSGPVTYAIVMRHVDGIQNMGNRSNGGQYPAEVFREIMQ